MKTIKMTPLSHLTNIIKLSEANVKIIWKTEINSFMPFTGKDDESYNLFIVIIKCFAFRSVDIVQIM